MAKQQKTEAEIYREERKKRLAKAAKKNSKKQISSDSSKLAGKIVGIVFVCAVAIALLSVVLVQAGVKDKMTTAFNVGDEKVSQIEYKYYYMQAYNQISQYAQYVGLDTSKEISTQEYAGTFGEIENFPEDQTPMWSDYFDYSAKQQIQYIYAAKAEAKKLGLTLGEKENADIESTLDQYRTYAKSAGGENTQYSLSAYLKASYGKGMNERVFKNILKDQHVLSLLEDTKEDELKKTYTAKQIEKEYKDNTESYAAVTFRAFTVAAKTEKKDEESEAATTSETMAEAKKLAEKVSKATSEKEFKKLASEVAKTMGNSDYKTIVTDDAQTLTKDKTKTDLSQTVTDEGTLEFLFGAKSKAGQTYLCENENDGYTVYMLVNPMHKAPAYETYDSRHILINFTENDEETANEDAESAETADAKDETKETKKADAKEVAVTPLDITKYKDQTIDLAVTADKAKDKEAFKKAQDILEEFLKGDKSEASFAKLAEKNSEDTGSNTNGGLYENTAPGSFVKPYEEWCLKKGRKAGDVGIVEVESSNYSGYHIIYFIGTNTVKWDDAIKSELAEHDFQDYADKLKNADTVKIDNVSEKVAKAVASDLDTMVLNQAKQSSQEVAY